MSQLVKTKVQANFKDFKRFGVFKGLVEQKKTLYSTRFTRVLNWPTHAKKKPNLHTNLLNKLLHISL
jgi:hypothetical protein